MKRLITLISIFTLSTMIYAQCDVDGNYRVSALDVQYYDIARQTTNINVSDAYGLGVELTLLTINAGDVFYSTHSGPYNETTLAAIGVNLNVNFNEDDCTASLAEGSYYPDVNEENCISSVQVLPIIDDMIFSSNQDVTGLTPTPSTNLVGFPSISARAGEYHGGLSLDQALIFDYFPQGGEGYINQYGPDFTPWTGDEVAPVSLPTDVNNPEDGSTLWPAGMALPGVHGGWITVGDVGESQIPTSSGTPSGFAEWHAIDGPASESGLGDFLNQDEDGYDGDYDRTFGLPVLPTATYFNDDEMCLVYGTLGGVPVAGDVTEPILAGVTGSCYATVLDGVYGGCIAQVQDAVVGQATADCGAADASMGGDGSNATAAVFGTCVEGALSLQGACEYYGVYNSVLAGCLDVAGATGDPSIEAMCETVAATYEAGFGGAWGVDPAGACSAAIDHITTYGDPDGFCYGATMMFTSNGTMTCDDFAQAILASYSEEELDAAAAAVAGASCTETQAGLAAGYAAGDAGAIATLDALAAGVLGMSCGDYSSYWGSTCIAGVDVATDVWVMDPSGASATWGNFATFHGILLGQALGACAAYGLDQDACFAAGYANPAWLTDDSGAAADPTCLMDGDPSDCSGRVLFNFAPTCIPEIEVRQVVIEFTEVGGECVANGDANEDGTTNILDVVGMVAAILGNGSLSDSGACNADINADGTLNILDVVGTVQAILGNNRSDYASNVTINKTDEGATFSADGYVGGIQITLSHDDNFEMKLTEDALVADYNTNGKETTLIVIAPEGSDLFTTDDSYTIKSAVSASADNYINTDVSVPVSYDVGNAYPNPFNPTTSFNITLENDANVSVKVYNVMGQLVSTISEGALAQGVHTFTWDASTLSSGVYFVNSQVGNDVSTQKVMLVK